MHLPDNVAWHNLPATRVTELLAGDRSTGLDQADAEDRLNRHGPNTVTTQRRQNPLVRFLLQFHQPLIYILIVSGIITASLHEWVDSAVIFGVVLANGVVGYLQESKAVHALAALARTMTSRATVLRGGVRIRISAAEIVPGDIVLLEPGDKIPADMRLLAEQGLQIDESALTGESLPAAKSTAPLEEDMELAGRTNMAYATTLVTYGQATGIVVATGDTTEVGRISQLIASARELETPLTKKISSFSQLLLYLILLLAAVTVLVGLIRGMGMFDMFMAAVALAVGAIPEGLPAAVTITLAIGVSKMAGRKAIIRKLPAVETLGSTTVICSDKTGTLTENKMTVQEIMAGEREYVLSGSGYTPEQGRIKSDNEPVNIKDHPALYTCLLAGTLCNDSRLVRKDDIWQVQGDPTEGALLVAAGKAGLPFHAGEHPITRLDSVPFASEHQFMASLVRQEDDSTATLYVKGSMEVVLAGCKWELDAGGEKKPLDRKKIHQQVEKMAAKGLRVLAFAKKEGSADTEIVQEDVLSDLTLIGLQGMMDPPREEAAAAVRTCQQAGILVKMITGDHALTATAIAERMGIKGPLQENEGGTPSVLTGRELEKISDNELADIVHRTSVFARTSPEQKLRLVRALQQKGHVVAMTGDGVNDAPALKQADIGIAMGMGGTEVAREAADMVLTDDNFTSIEAAVEEGRGVFDNLTKFIVWTLPTNIGEGLVIVAAIFLGVTLPIIPVQILWINMTTAGFLGLMLAFEPKEQGIMLRSPREPDASIISRPLGIRISLVSILLLASAFILFNLEIKQGATIEQARTVAVNTFVVIELFYLFNCRSLTASVFRLGLFTNLWVIGGVTVMLVIQLIYTYAPFMHYLFKSAPISLVSWLHIFIAGLLSAWLVEAEKKISSSIFTTKT